MSILYKTIIIEDEPLAQNILRRYIDDHPSLELVAVCNDAISAQVILQEQSIPLIFLDINLPKLSGIKFIKTLSNPPAVIFTTAYPEFAIQGFELDAVDYLLKPFSFERFLKAVNKALEKIKQTSTALQYSETKAPGFIFLKSNKKVHKVDLNSIIYIEAVGDYIKVVTDTSSILVNETMKNILEELPSDQFRRVHKSFIITSSRIKYFEGNFVQVGNTSIPIGATYREEIFSEFEKKNKR